MELGGASRNSTGFGAMEEGLTSRGGTPRGNPACRGTFAVASRVSSTVSPFRAEHGTSLETPETSVFPWSETGMLGNFGDYLFLFVLAGSSNCGVGEDS